MPGPHFHRLGPGRRLRRPHDGQRGLCLPDTGGLPDEQAAPLLCAGIIGYRALARAAVPEGGRLGIYGFGGSAHLAAQVAMHRGASVYVMTRSEEARRLALELGAAFAGDADDEPPVPLDSAILFAPVGWLVPQALRALDRGGTLAVAGIHLSDIPPLHYGSELFQERQLRSVTANTRADGEEFLRVAAEIPLRPTTVSYRMEDAARALRDLAADRITGSGGPPSGLVAEPEFVVLPGVQQHVLGAQPDHHREASPGAAETSRQSLSRCTASNWSR